jgi:TPP-dependent pyruvate/acetoin dehydrogenase alpha subunit
MDPDEFASAEANEPVGKYRRWLLETRGVTEATLAAIEEEVAAEVEAAVESAKAADPPPPDELLVDVFADPVAVPR